MFEVHKRYVFDQNGNAGSFRCAKGNAVQIPIDEFEQIEKMLNFEKSRSDTSDFQEDCELKEVDGLLVVKSQGVTIPASIVEDMREERI